MKSLCIFLVSVAMIFVSCKRKNTPIEKLEDLSETLSENTDDYTEQDWEDVAAEFKEIVEDIAEHSKDYTKEELQEIGRLTSKCMLKLSKAYMKEAAEGMKDAGHIMKGFMDGLQETDWDSEFKEVEETFKDIEKEFKEELSR